MYNRHPYEWVMSDSVCISVVCGSSLTLSVSTRRQRSKAKNGVMVTVAHTTFPVNRSHDSKVASTLLRVSAGSVEGEVGPVGGAVGPVGAMLALWG